MIERHNKNFEEFFECYLVAALFSSSDESDEQGGQPLDLNFDTNDFDADSLAMMRAHCESFYYRVYFYLEADTNDVKLSEETNVYQQAGHDFWMTSNGHGVGFWDGDWPCYGELFTKIAGYYPEINISVSDERRELYAS